MSATKRLGARLAPRVTEIAPNVTSAFVHQALAKAISGVGPLVGAAAAEPSDPSTPQAAHSAAYTVDRVIADRRIKESSGLARSSAVATGIRDFSIPRGARPPSLSRRWNVTSPSTRVNSQREKPSNGWPLKMAMSPSLPTSIEPSRLSRPNSVAGLIVIMARAWSSLTWPYFTILAASR